MVMRVLCSTALAVAFALLSAPTFAGDVTFSPDGALLSVPIPIVAHPLFQRIPEASNPSCPTRTEVLHHYIASGSALKSGRVQLLAGDLPQAFADVWRRHLHLPKVPVSSVVGQPLNLASLGGGDAVDVTEFGADGCAITRTIMPLAIWMDLIRTASGVSV